MTIARNTLDIDGVLVHGLWRCQSGEGHVTVARDDGHLDIYSTRSSSLRRFVRQQRYLSEKRKVLTDSELDSIIATIDALCDLDGNSVSLGVRTASLDDSICIDGIDTTYLVRRNGWSKEIIERPLFRRNASMLPLVHPVAGGDPKQIFRFVNIKDPLDQILFLTHMIFSFVPDLPHPMGIFYGSQGAAKTTAMKFYISIVDPNSISDVHSLSESDFLAAASQRWVVGLDNLSFINSRFSDTLCKVVTGMSFLRRILYTTDSMLAQNFLRVVLANGINLPAEKADLLDRSILFMLERLTVEERRDESSLMKEFESVRGEIVGGCLDALAKAMNILPSVTHSFNTRMVDYARWGCAIAVALGYRESQFIEAIERNTARQNEESLDASPLVALLAHCFGRTSLSKLEGTASDILKELRTLAPEAGIDLRSLPQTPRILGKKLAEVKPNLEVEGYKLFFNRGRQRHWVIEPPQKLKDEYHATQTTLATSRFPHIQNKPFGF